jgi:hypothetical protein
VSTSTTGFKGNKRRRVGDVRGSSIRCFISCSRLRFWTGVSAGVGGIPGWSKVPLSPVRVRVRIWDDGFVGSPFLVRGEVRWVCGGIGKKFAGRKGASGQSLG